MLNEEFFTDQIDTIGPDEYLDQTLPWYADLMESYPSITTSAAVKVGRARNTAIYGGYAQSGRVRNALGKSVTAPHLRGGWVREGVSQANYLKPRNVSRFAESRYFHQDIKLQDKKYTPFYISQMGNAAARFMMGGKSGENIASRRAGLLTSKNIQGHSLLTPGEDAFSRGGMARLSAGAKIANMGRVQYASNAASVNQFLADAGIGLPQGPTRGGAPIRFSQREAATLTMASGSGTLSSRVGGFISRLDDVDAVSTLSRTAGVRPEAAAGARTMESWARQIGLADDAGRVGRITMGSTLRGTAQATGRASGLAAKAGTIARGAGVAGGIAAKIGSRAIPVLGWALLAYDAAKLATKGVGYLARTGLEARRSFEGGARIGIMQQTFMDTEATMTSRARGVQAIQNSRLNARSVLGAEASMMASHFG